MNTISAAQDVSNLLGRSAQLLEQAAQRIRGYAERAASGDAGSPDDGRGYHFLVDQALREVQSLGPNLPIGQAFRAAAEADRAQ